MTHPETIQVPDGWTVADCNMLETSREAQRLIVVLKPLPPPEPEILPCPFCGGKIRIVDLSEYWGAYCQGLDCSMTLGTSFPTRLAAIEAANRRAP